MLKAIIFDMDGVIVDTEPQHLRAMIEAAATFDAALTYDYCTKFIGCNLHDTLAMLTVDYPQIEPTMFTKLFDEKKIEIKQNEGLIPIAGTIALIRSLPSHNIKAAIASSSAPHEIKLVVDNLGLSDYIDVIVSGSMVKHSKPEPDIFLLAAEQLGVSTQECIIIEDSMNGSIAAMCANIPCIGFQNKNSGNQDLSRTCCIYEDMAALDFAGVLEEYNRYHGYPVTILETERLIIREFSIHDVEALYDIYQQEGITDYIPPLGTLSEEKAKMASYIERHYNFYRFGLWGIFDKKTDQLIGCSGIQCVDLGDKTEIELAYLTSLPCQQKGYALEYTTAILSYVKEHYDFDSLVALIHPENKASLQLIQTLGFTYETMVPHKGMNCLLYRLPLCEASVEK